MKKIITALIVWTVVTCGCLAQTTNALVATVPDFTRLTNGMALVEFQKTLGMSGRPEENSSPVEAFFDFDFNGEWIMAIGRVHGINREKGKTHLVIVPGMKYSDVRTILAQCGAKEIPGSFAALETAPHTYQLPARR